jgi:hypothetical protein
MNNFWTDIFSVEFYVSVLNQNTYLVSKKKVLFITHSAKKVKDIVVCDQQMKKREHNQYKCLIPFIFSQINTE